MEAEFSFVVVPQTGEIILTGESTGTGSFVIQDVIDQGFYFQQCGRSVVSFSDSYSTPLKIILDLELALEHKRSGCTPDTSNLKWLLFTCPSFSKEEFQSL